MSIHASIEPDGIRPKFTKSLRTVDIGFTVTEVCKGGVEVSGELIGRSEQGLVSAAGTSAGTWPCRAGTTSATGVSGQAS